MDCEEQETSPEEGKKVSQPFALPQTEAHASPAHSRIDSRPSSTSRALALAHPPMPPFEPLSTTHSSRTSSIQSDQTYPRAPSSRHLRPEDAFPSASPPYQQPRSRSPLGRSDTVTAATAHLVNNGNTGNATRKHREKRRGRSSSRRRHRPWKKLLWVKQSYPDNYTDEETFLDHLQRNPRLQPYEFWTLVADSTIIVQHVCSVIIFVCCFTGIFQERVSPNAVVGWATFGTVAGWVLKDYWHTMEEEQDEIGDFDRSEGFGELREEDLDVGTPASLDAGFPPKEPAVPTNGAPSRVHSRNPSTGSVPGLSQPQSPPPVPNNDTCSSPAPSPTYIPPYNTRPSSLSPRMIERLATAKSAILIYFSLLGLSPILKSLTKSTSSDSIWALSSWLMCINVFTFDYGAGPEAK
jgi:phosphatidylinositol glycan class C protein